MTGFDILVLVVVGALASFGFLRGFVQEAISLFAWGFSIFAIHNLHSRLSDVLAPHIGTESGASVLAFAILALVPYMLVRLLAKYLGAASRNSVLGPVDRVLGFGFGAVKGTLIIVLGFSVLVLGYDTIWGAGGRPTWITKSRTYPFVNASSEALVKMISERRRQAAEGADPTATDTPSPDAKPSVSAKSHHKTSHHRGD
jgi:membrane protein required for colicin V production